jgi:hypothetical protein
MLDNEKVKKYLFSGKPTKYDEQKHIGLLVDLFSNGESTTAFCAEALIDKKTFYNWLKAHERFKNAYDIVVNIAGRKWEEMPLTNPDINYQYWYMTMKNRFGYGKPRIEASEDQTPQGRINAIWKALENGELTPDEISKLASLAVAQANIKANESDTQTSTIRETRESLMEKIEKIQKVIDYAKSQEQA